MTYSDFHLACRAVEAALQKRIEALEAERDNLREKADYSYEDTTRLAELRTLALAAVATGLNMGDITWVNTTEFDALAAGLEVKGD